MIRPSECRHVEDAQPARPRIGCCYPQRIAGLGASDDQHLPVSYHLARMIGSSHLVAMGRFEPAKSGDGESEHIQIPIIISMIQVVGAVRRAPQDETVVPPG
jgi:hypothetical protein